MRCTHMLARTAIVLVALATTAAADPKVCSTPPTSRTPRAMTVTLEHRNLLAPAPGSEFPAISEDGSRFVELFDEMQDFTGFPIRTLVVWSRTGKELAEVSTAEDGPASGERPTNADDRASLRKAVAALAGTKWRPLDRFTSCERDERTIQLPDGASVSLDVDHQTLVVSKPRSVTKMKRPGFNAETKGPCGSYVRLGSAFGGTADGAVVVTVVPQLGGDMCSGAGMHPEVIPLR